MRISEIANAEEQVGLLKIIMDKTWEAIMHISLNVTGGFAKA